MKMSNDLISRSALLEDFRNTITEQSDTMDWLDMIARQPIAYDEDKVIQQINSIGKLYCNSVKCGNNCKDCDHGCVMRAITEKVKAGGID